ncbi:aryl-sulfate sulfotransferase [Candidatus Neomarinimicrobiota bacterium]
MKKNIYMLLIILIGLSFSKIYSQNDNTIGLISKNDGVSDGYVLFGPKNYTSTYLIDNDGLVINEWESAFLPGMTAYLLENGNLLRSTQLESETSNLKGGFQLLDWGGAVLWEYYHGPQHHDIEPLSNGNVLVLSNNRKTFDDLVAMGRNPDLITDSNLRGLRILEISQTGPQSGEIVWEWSVWDHLIQDFDASKANYGIVENHPELVDLNYADDGSQDWLHPNSVAYNPDLDQIIISVRGFNEVWVIDHNTIVAEAQSHSGGNRGKGGDLLYRWGNPEAYRAGTIDDKKLLGQHDAYWLKNGLAGAGNIMVFNNGWPNRGYSSVDEIIPAIDIDGNYPLTPGEAFGPDSAFWVYKDPVPENFYSARFSGSQRLPNGNTYICSGDPGRLFEIKSDETKVWEYINPVAKSGPQSQGTTLAKGDSEVGRSYRYMVDYPGLVDKDLAPGDPIELYPPLNIDDESSVPVEFKLYNNYPNPFNASTNIQFQILQESKIELTIFSLLGSKITTLVKDVKNPGLYSVMWNGNNTEGSPVVSGIYFYVLRVGSKQAINKMMLLK